MTDVVAEDMNQFYLVRFVSDDAKTWLKGNINTKKSEWVGGRLMLKKTDVPSFTFAMFNAELECVGIEE